MVLPARSLALNNNDNTDNDNVINNNITNNNITNANITNNNDNITTTSTTTTTNNNNDNTTNNDDDDIPPGLQHQRGQLLGPPPGSNGRAVPASNPGVPFRRSPSADGFGARMIM